MPRTIRSRSILLILSLATAPLLLVGAIIAWQSYLTQQQQTIALQREVARRVSTQVGAFIYEQEQTLRTTVHTHGFAGLDRDQQRNILALLQAQQGTYEELVLLDSDGQEQIRLTRFQIVVDADLEDRSGQEEFTAPKTSGEVYYSPVLFEDLTGEPLLTIALPLSNIRSGSVEGVLVARVRFKPIWDLLAGLQVSGGETVYIVDNNGNLVAHRNPSIVLRGTSFTLPEEDGTHIGLSGSQAVLASNKVVVGNQEFNIVAEQPFSEALAPTINTVITTAIVLIITLITTSAIGYTAVRRIIGPVQALATTAEAINAGDLSRQAEMTGLEETDTLANAFNNMTGQLRRMLIGLEERVTERTRALEVSAEVSRRLSTILDRDELVAAVVEQIKNAFNYYHVHIYLLDETGQNLVMTGGTGDAGREMLAKGHKVSRHKGLVGRAATTNDVVLAADTTKEPGWLPNPLLLDTKAEVAVPIAIGEHVLGVLDVQENKVDGLGERDTILLSSIAAQVAVALQNANLYNQAQRQAERQALVNLIGQKIQSAVTIEAVLETAVQELGQALRSPATRVQLNLAAVRSKEGNLEPATGETPSPRK